MGNYCKTIFIVWILMGNLFLVDSYGEYKEPYLVCDIKPGTMNSDPTLLTSVGNTLFFVVDYPEYSELWKSDGTKVGTTALKVFFHDTMIHKKASIGELTNVNGTLFFVVDDLVRGKELWKSDGTVAGTVLVKDIVSGQYSSNPSNLTNVNGALFFFVKNSMQGLELWRSNGSDIGTYAVKKIRENHHTNSLIKDELLNINGTLFFSVDDDVHGREVWRSDGTEYGTFILVDIAPGNSGSSRYLTNVNGTLFFKTHGLFVGKWRDELWKSDGTKSGTVKILEISCADLTNINGTLYFASGSALWKSDGTEQGTVFVKDFNQITSLTSANGVLFLTNFHQSARELWAVNGTNTVLLRSLPNNINVTFSATNVNGTLFFAAYDNVNGVELWQSNGTLAGTSLVKDIKSGITSSYPQKLVNVNGQLFFSAGDWIYGRELWALVSDK